MVEVVLVVVGVDIVVEVLVVVDAFYVIFKLLSIIEYDLKTVKP